VQSDLILVVRVDRGLLPFFANQEHMTNMVNMTGLIQDNIFTMFYKLETEFLNKGFS